MQNQNSGVFAAERRAACLEPDNLTKLEALRSRISGLLGEKNAGLLREYTGRMLAQFNADSDWFRQKWLEDAWRADH